MSHSDVSKSHLDTDGTGVDGSGAIAIKMVHTDTKWTIAADIIRIVFSICLLIFSTISVIYAIATTTTTMPESFPPWSQYLCLFISLFILGTLEGLQIGVVELAHKDPNNYRKLYPRAARLLAFENKGRNVERFLMGRQVLVVFTVFVAARITTFDGFWAEVPQSLIHGLMFSGFLGVILVVIVAQLTPQVLAAAYPVEFMNIPGMKYAFWACLIVEATGLVHAVWFLCVTVKKIFWNCLCEKGEHVDFSRVSSKSPDSMKDVGVDVVGADIHVDKDMLHTAAQAEVVINEEVELVERHKEEANGYRAEHLAENDDVQDQMQELIDDVGNNRDLFYIYGDKKYMAPSQCYDKFKESGLTPPNFLLPPDNKDHIPPHIIAMTLLKMYTTLKNEVDANELEKNKDL